MKRNIITALVLFLSFLLAAQAKEIEWDKARALCQKMRRGQTLTAEEKSISKSYFLPSRKQGKVSPSKCTPAKTIDSTGTTERAKKL